MASMKRSDERTDDGDPTATRRAFLAGVVGVGVSALAVGCEAPTQAPCPAAGDAAAASDAPHDGGAPPTSAGPRPEVAAAALPYRQDDPAWGADLMWDRDLVIRAEHELNGATLADARALLRAFDDGNNIANEGCLLTALAMVLRLYVPHSPPWTPRTLNAAAQEAYYYTRCGLSMTALYADLVSELSDGAVQLAMKEEYLAGEPGWTPVHPNTSALVRAYRSLRPAERADVLLLLKTGTYDDTVASHYLLLHPDDEGSPDDANPTVLDPAMPLDRTGVWRLRDSADAITQDPDIAQAWVDARIAPTQIGGVWAFARWDRARARPRVAALARAWALELASSGG